MSPLREGFFITDQTGRISYSDWLGGWGATPSSEQEAPARAHVSPGTPSRRPPAGSARSPRRPPALTVHWLQGPTRFLGLLWRGVLVLLLLDVNAPFQQSSLT